MKKKRYGTYLTAALLVAFGGLGTVLATGTSPRLGLDLEGGISVILTATGESVEQDVLERTVSIIRERIDAIGVAEPEVSIAGTENILIQLPGIKDEEQALEVIGTTAQLTFRQVKSRIGAQAEKRPDVTQDTSQAVNDEVVVYPSGQSDEKGVLYELEPARLTGDVVEVARANINPSGGGWFVEIEMNSAGSKVWEKFTSRLACLRDEGEQVRSQVAIVLDGKVESAAGMQDPATAGAGGGVECGEGIGGGQTQIDVGDEKEAKDLAVVLRTGALPITLEQSEVSKVSPTLGRDSLNAGLLAGGVGLVLVMLYVVAYYRALGLIVWLGLMVFASVLYTILSLLGEGAGLSLSLAGVAGVIVSIGITTDSYIVAFERLKDEVRSGKTIRASVDRGMVRAFRTILIADFVTASAAAILFWLAVGPVRGFALTLGLATLTDVLVAYFFTRSAVMLLARTRFFAGSGAMGFRAALGART